MRHRQPRGWDSGLTFLLISGIIVLAALFGGPLVMGADWRVQARFTADYDTAYTLFYENMVLQDSSAGRADDNEYDTTFTYTTGNYLQCFIWYKYYADDEWGTYDFEYYSASATGDGPYSVTFLTWDSTTDMAVPRVDLTVRPVDQSSLAGKPKTDASGYGTANLTADSFVVIEDVPGWTQDNTLDTFLVTGANDTFTVYMDQFDPGAPSGANFCIVYGYLSESRDATTRRIKNRKICFTPTKTVRNSCSDTWIVSGTVKATTNENGIFQIELAYSSCMIDDDGNEVKYTVTIEGEDGETEITVPDADSYQMWTE